MPDRRSVVITIAATIFLSLGVSCQRKSDPKAGAAGGDDLTAQSGKLSASQQTAANSALKSLRKIAAATDVGVSYSQYGSLLIEAKPEVDEALAVLPESQFRSDITTAMEAYLDSREAWGEMMAKDKLPLTYGIGKKLVEKYAMAFQTRGDRAIIYDSTRDRVVEDLWKHARIYLNSASHELTKVGG